MDKLSPRFKLGLLAILTSLALLFFALKAFSSGQQDLTPEENVKAQITHIISPLIHKDNFRVEVTHLKKDVTLQKQTIALLIDETKLPTIQEIDRIDSLIRAAVGHDATRGDILRITSAPFLTSNNFLTKLSAEQKLFAFEALIVLLLFFLLAFLIHSKNKETKKSLKPLIQSPQTPPSFSERVTLEPVKAAAILRVWLRGSA